MRGPVAPKDPTKQRPRVYFILEDQLVTAHPGQNGYSEIVFLEGRVKTKLSLICPELDPEFAESFQHSDTFRNTVHSIGITVEPELDSDRELPVTVRLQHYGKSKKYETGSFMKMEILADGAERVFSVDELENGGDDDILGTLYIDSEKQGFSGKLTMVFYLRDGFTAPVPKIDPPIAWESAAYEELLSRSLLSLGRTGRLKAAIQKAKAGEDVTIAFIGGSITQGAGAKPIERKSYAYLTYDLFRTHFAKDPEKVHLVKAGVGGTSSEFGLVRYGLHVLRDGVEPDIVIVEFAVNDEGDETKGICYESLLNRISDGPGKPAVILLFSVFMDDYNLEDRLVPIGRHYNLPMVSIKRAVSPQFANPEGRVLTKRQYFYDCYHPSNDGHKIMADCLFHLFCTCDKSEAVPDGPWPDTALLGREYSNPLLLDRNLTGTDFMLAGISVDHGSFGAVDTELQDAEWDLDPAPSPIFENNWMRPAHTNDLAPFFLRLRCRYLFIIIKDSGAADAGDAEIYVNGRPVRTLCPKEIGWNHCSSLLVIPDGEEKDYDVKISPKSGTEDGFFTILGFAYGKN